MDSFNATSENPDEQQIKSEVFPIRVDEGVGEVPPRLPGSLPEKGKFHKGL